MKGLSTSRVLDKSVVWRLNKCHSSKLEFGVGTIHAIISLERLLFSRVTAEKWQVNTYVIIFHFRIYYSGMRRRRCKRNFMPEVDAKLFLKCPSKVNRWRLNLAHILKQILTAQHGCDAIIGVQCVQS